MSTLVLYVLLLSHFRVPLQLLLLFSRNTERFSHHLTQTDLLALKREKDNDERQLRKVSRKLHQYANARREASIRATAPNAPSEALLEDQQTITEALQNVQIELDAFLLLMEKLELVRLAERRQAEEYEAMRQRICEQSPFVM